MGEYEILHFDTLRIFYLNIIKLKLNIHTEAIKIQYFSGTSMYDLCMKYA